jgi:glycosyltransferase involved in cell wall biosynthesis
MKEKIGIGVITCNRPDFLKKCIKSLNKDWYNELVIVNDGIQKIEQPGMNIINNEVNQGVGKSKNKAIKFLLERDCEHIFLVEDDVYFLENAFEAYIEASKKTKVKHFNYCLHGQDNKQNNTPNPRKIFEIRGQRVALYFNVYGACSYYHRSVFEEIGLIDEEYINAMEHVDHTMIAINHKYHPPFRWFIDLENSNQYIVDQDYHHDKSTIRKGNWMENFRKGIERFKQKHNVDVTNPGQSYDGIEKVIEYFKSL